MILLDLKNWKKHKIAQNSKLIIFAKGGWGSARLLEKEPSWQHGLMLGFSDTWIFRYMFFITI